MKAEYRFSIDSLTPETLSLGRLVAYLTELSKVLGDEPGLHFERIEAGSAVLLAWADESTRPKINSRIDQVRTGNMPIDIQRANAKINNLLHQDNAVGFLTGGDAAVIEFPGRKILLAAAIGPIQQVTVIEGQLVRIGGKDRSVHFHLTDGDRVWSGVTSRHLARDMASHLFGSTLRVTGNGSWTRAPSGAWELARFTASSMEMLDDTPLPEALERLRALGGFSEGPSWMELRNSEDES